MSLMEVGNVCRAAPFATGTLGIFAAAAACDEVHAYGFTPYDDEVATKGGKYGHDSAGGRNDEDVDNVFLLQFAFIRLLHCLGLITEHGYAHEAK